MSLKVDDMYLLVKTNFKKPTNLYLSIYQQEFIESILMFRGTVSLLLYNSTLQVVTPQIQIYLLQK